jgi:hypothetical protein
MNVLLDGWPQRNTTANASASAPEEVAKWVEEVTPDGQCTVNFPGTPTKETINLGGIDLHRSTLQRDAGKGYFALTYVEVPAAQATASADDFLDNWRNNNLNAEVPGGGRFKLLKERKLEKDGVVGRWIDMQAGRDRVSLNRVFLSNQRMYRLNVVVVPALQENPDVLQFLDSVAFKR